MEQLSRLRHHPAPSRPYRQIELEWPIFSRSYRERVGCLSHICSYQKLNPPFVMKPQRMGHPRQVEPLAHAQDHGALRLGLLRARPRPPDRPTNQLLWRKTRNDLPVVLRAVLDASPLISILSFRSAAEESASSLSCPAANGTDINESLFILKTVGRT